MKKLSDAKQPKSEKADIKAAGLFGKVTPRMVLPEPLPAPKPVPECAAFEEDFTSYLGRLKEKNAHIAA